jgi:hypothetical protein
LSLATMSLARYRWYHAEQKRALYALVDPISPPIRHQKSGNRYQDFFFLMPDPSLLIPGWWRRRVLPPGPKGLFRRPFIAIAGICRPAEYSAICAAKKDGLRSAMPNLRSPQEAVGASCSSIHRIARAGARAWNPCAAAFYVSRKTIPVDFCRSCTKRSHPGEALNPPACFPPPIGMWYGLHLCRTER